MYYLHVLFFGGAASLFFLAYVRWAFCRNLQQLLDGTQKKFVVNCKKHTIGLIWKWIEVYLFSLWLAVN